MKPALYFAAVLLILGATGCTSDFGKAHEPEVNVSKVVVETHGLRARLTTAEVYRLAVDYAKRRISNLDRYEIISWSLNAKGEKVQWSLSFYPKGDESVIGEDFSILVDDDTKRVGWFGGL